MAGTFYRSMALIVLVVLVGITVCSYQVRAFRKSEAPVPQDVISLDRRISLIEQRFYAIESRLNRIEQQVIAAQRVSPPTTATRANEINILSSEIDSLRRRLVEVECGVVRLDERTVPAVGERSDKSSISDPCRLKPQEPIRLSARP